MISNTFNICISFRLCWLEMYMYMYMYMYVYLCHMHIHIHIIEFVAHPNDNFSYPRTTTFEMVGMFTSTIIPIFCQNCKFAISLNSRPIYSILYMTFLRIRGNEWEFVWKGKWCVFIPSGTTKGWLEKYHKNWLPVPYSSYPFLFYNWFSDIVVFSTTNFCYGMDNLIEFCRILVNYGYHL